MHLSSTPPLRAHHENKKQLMVLRHCDTAAAFDTTLKPLVLNMNSQKNRSKQGNLSSALPRFD